jgi:molecular chaperone GrpE
MPSSPVSDGGGRVVDERPEDVPAQATPTNEPAAGGSAGAAAGRPDGEARLAEAEDRYKRALADLDNYRKRSAREVERRVAESREKLLTEWLEAVDSVERALRMEPEGPLAQGLRAVLEQMDAILLRQGVHRIGSPGEPFDPERHEAVAVRHSAEAPDRTVLDVARSGFALDGRVLRPAQVVVSRRET